MLSILVKPSCLSDLSKMGVSNMRHRTESNNMQRGTLRENQNLNKQSERNRFLTVTHQVQHHKNTLLSTR